MKVTVYHFKVYNAGTNRWVIPPKKSSEERIARLGGKIINGTGEDVDVAQIDEDGRYDPDADKT